MWWSLLGLSSNYLTPLVFPLQAICIKDTKVTLEKLISNSIIKLNLYFFALQTVVVSNASRIRESYIYKQAVSPALGKEVCYPRLGCFTDDPPWSGVPGRLLTGLPDSPEEMNISFSLYTRETGNNSQVTFIFNIKSWLNPKMFVSLLQSLCQSPRIGKKSESEV